MKKITERHIETYYLQTVEKWQHPYSSYDHLCGLCVFAKRVAGVARARDNEIRKYCAYCPSWLAFRENCLPILSRAETDQEVVALLMDNGAELIRAMREIAVEYDLYEEAQPVLA